MIEEEAKYVNALLTGTDRAFPGWRANDMDGGTLYAIYASTTTWDGVIPPEATGLQRSIKQFDLIDTKVVSEFYEKILSILISITVCII